MAVQRRARRRLDARGMEVTRTVLPRHGVGVAA
jgi:hypothetical protein